MYTNSLLAVAAAVATTSATYTGFNYGNTFSDGSYKVESDYVAEFEKAKVLAGTNGEFTSARLYTMIQGDSTDTPIAAIPAAIDTQTSLLLGLWASGGDTDFENQLDALTSAISQYGTSLSDLIVGISVGSEDLYRNSVTGAESDAGVGAQPSTIASYITKVKDAIADTVASAAPVGHVDTWTAWVNSSNDAVIEACDWIGMDAYPYFQNTESNGIDVAKSLFFEALDNTKSAAGSVDVWVTETGWPVSGETENDAVASIANAKTYWDEVACELLGSVNTWWYILEDALPTTPDPSFGLIGSSLDDAPYFDLSCNATNTTTSSSATSSATSTSVATTAAAATTPATSAGTATASIEVTPGAEGTSSTSGASATSGASSATDAASATVATVTTVSGTDGTWTVKSTTYVTQGCSAVCSTAVTTLAGSSTSSTTLTVATSSATSTASVATTSPASATSSATTAASATGTSCPTNLDGAYQYPHLIVPVNSDYPTEAYGTQYDGYINSTDSTIFNFDIPSSYSGETCSLVFLFPELDELETSSYTWNNKGGITVNQLSTPATEATTYDTVPSVKTSAIGSISSLAAGNGYVITTGTCAAGETVSYEFVATDDLALVFFEDYNPSPLGAFITTC